MLHIMSITNGNRNPYLENEKKITEKKRHLLQHQIQSVGTEPRNLQA